MKHVGFTAFIAMLAVSSGPFEGRASETAAFKDIGSVCLETLLLNCRVLTAGFINVDGGEHDGQPLVGWQTQAGFTPEDGVRGGFVLFVHDADGWSVLDKGFEGGRYFAPTFNEAGLLHVVGYTGGTGAYNVDRLYQWGDLGGYADWDEGWREIEMHGWLETIGEMLPEGLEIWKGVEYDFRNPWMGQFARTQLWRATDGNCCPTGGDAVITLAIEDERLVATEVRYLPSPAGFGQ